MNEYFDTELARLEKQQNELRKNAEKEDRDRHSTLDENIDIHAYRRIVNAKINIAPTSTETLSQYVKKIKVYQEIAHQKNWQTHVDNPYKTWHTHKNPLGCFMCEDTAFIAVMIQVLEVLADKYPKAKF